MQLFPYLERVRTIREEARKPLMDEYSLCQSDNTIHANALEYHQGENLTELLGTIPQDKPSTHKSFDNPRVYLLSSCSLLGRQANVMWYRIKALRKRNAPNGGDFTRSEADLAGKGG